MRRFVLSLHRPVFLCKKPIFGLRQTAVCLAAILLLLLCLTPLALMNKPHAPLEVVQVAMGGNGSAAGLPASPAAQPMNAALRTQQAREVQGQAPVEIEIALVGDLMCHQSNLDAALDKASNTYDFAPFFANIKQHIQKSDVAIGNLETTFAGESAGYRGYPRFNSPTQYVDTLQDIGFDVLTNANNHAYDFGVSGVLGTQQALAVRNIGHTGAGQTRPITVDVQGVRLGILAYTAMSNAKAEAGLLNYLYQDGALNQSIATDLAYLREQEVDFIMMSLHWGNEYATKPTAAMQRDAQQLADMGVDAIIGHHPHVVQPIEVIAANRAEATVQVPVVYSLGNFFCNPSQNGQTAEGMIAYLRIAKTGDSTDFVEIDYLPTFTHRDTQMRGYDVLPLETPGADALPFTDDIRLAKRMDAAWKNTTEIAGIQLLSANLGK